MVVEQDQPLGGQPQDLAAELGADRAAGPAHQHHLVGYAGAKQVPQGRNGIAAQQFFNGNGSQGIDAGAPRCDLFHTGNLQHRDAKGLKGFNDSPPFAAAEGRDREQDLAGFAAANQPGYLLGEQHGEAIDVSARETGVVIDKAQHPMALGISQG